MTTQRTSVLIVGGGLTGLSSALFLAWHGVDCVLVERHPDLLAHPRLRGITARTVELYRPMGLEPAIRARTFANSAQFRWVPVRAETLAGEHTPVIEGDEEGAGDDGGAAGQAGQSGQPDQGGDRGDAAGTPEPPDVSPCLDAPIDQDQLETVVRDRALALGADLRYATELTSFEQDDDGVTARLTDRRSGRTTSVRADYLIAADGASGTIRERLGVETDGPGVLFHTVTALIDADLTPALRGREISIAYLDRPRPGTVLFSHDQDARRWVFGTGYSPESESPADFTDERVADLVRAASGLPDLQVTLRTQIPGTDLKVLGLPIGGRVARRYRVGRVFLAGDAAHIMPPTGGLGGNTGVQDAHNLAWKLAAVLAGTAGPDLLDTYHDERHAVGLLTMRQALARFGARMIPGVSDDPIIEHSALVFGYQYRSAAIAGGAADTAPVSPRQLSGAPGTRAPHVWMRREGDDTSTIDLYGRNFVVLAGPDGAAWIEQAHRASDRLGVRIAAHRPDADLTAYGIGSSGAVLVRPDGFVAWRATEAPEAPRDNGHPGELTEVLRRLLRREQPAT